MKIVFHTAYIMTVLAILSVNAAQLPRPKAPRQEAQDPRTLNLPEPPEYMCRRTAGPITVDGRLDEASWQKARWLGPFVDMEKGTKVQYDYDMRHGSFDWDFPGLQTAIYVDGSLNWNQDRDRGWSGELVFPWKGWGDLAQGVRSIPPKEGDIWRIGCSRVEHGRDAQGRIVWGRDWSIAQHGKIQMHVPHRWPYVIFTKEVVGQ